MNVLPIGKIMIKNYDPLIKSAAAAHLPGTDWRLVKAQLFQESRLNPDAISKRNAKGIAQFMPDTWEDMRKQLHMPADASPHNPILAIPAMTYYMAQLNKKWNWPRPDADRYALALASYNAGFGNIADAQTLANNATSYAPIIAQLHRVTGKDNARETREYVAKIFDYWKVQILEG
jgi:soluble lytic murein transglycosylase-like protein